VAAKSPARTAKSPARSRTSRPKSSSPKQKRAQAEGRRSRTSAKEKEENGEDEEKVEDKEEKDEEEEPAAAADEDEPADDDDDKEKEDGVEVEPMDEDEPVDKIQHDDETAPSRPDAVVAEDTAAQPATASEPEDLVCVTEEEDVPHVDRKRKFEEIEDQSDDDDVEEIGVVSPAKVLKVCEESDVKTVNVDAPVDGEMTSVDETAAESESKMSLPISSETNIEDDYVVITPDDVPPVDSDEVLNTAAKMLQQQTAGFGSCSNATVDAVHNPLLKREYVANPAVFPEPSDTSRCFTVGSYNILADFHAQKDYGNGMASWLTAEELSLSSRHQRLMEELIYLDEDVICLQEVGGDYMHDMLQPALER